MTTTLFIKIYDEDVREFLDKKATKAGWTFRPEFNGEEYFYIEVETQSYGFWYNGAWTNGGVFGGTTYVNATLEELLEAFKVVKVPDELVDFEDRKIVVNQNVASVNGGKATYEEIKAVVEEMRRRSK